MTNQNIDHFLTYKKTRLGVMVTCLLCVILMTVCLDFLYSRVQNTSFYISESLLFSTFWVLFIPLLLLQLRISEKATNIFSGVAVSGVMILLHLFSYPAMVWFLSEMFYNHTFSYVQTFHFGLTTYFIQLVILYSLPIPLMVLYKRISLQRVDSMKEEEIVQPDFITSLIVSDINNQKIVLETKEIFYFSANSPYIKIHHPAKRYLQTSTLRSLETNLDSALFIRIHKSCIINITKVHSYTSRHNGDYDLILADGSTLRVSRNYAARFKATLESYSRLTI